jgi:hypothetical protein
MKPYSTLFGALKVVDEVAVAIEVHLPARRPYVSPYTACA